LLVINSNITPAVGTILYLSGTVLDSGGSPVRDAHIEIWHADNTGARTHNSKPQGLAPDESFKQPGYQERQPLAS